MSRNREALSRAEAIALEEDVKRLYRSDLALALERSEAFLARATEPGAVRGRALRARGNTLRAAGRYEESLAAFDQALEEFRGAREEAEWASTQTARVAALAQMGRHQEALEAARAGLEVMLAHGRYDKASRLLTNMGGIHYYLGNPCEALACYDRSEEMARLAPPDPGASARRNHSRAVVLQQVGRYAESLEAAREAGAHFAAEGLHVSLARSLMVQGAALLYLGRYGEGLVTLGRSRALFAEHATPRDVLVCDLFLSACYLELGRLEETVARAEAAVQRVSQDQAPFEVACAHTYRGVALGRLGEVEAARDALGRAGRWFADHGYASWAAYTALEQAELALRAGAWAEAEAAAREAGTAFSRATMAALAARAGLIRADAILSRSERGAGRRSVEVRVRPLLARAGRVARSEGLPGLAFRVAHLKGRLALLGGRYPQAVRHLRKAIGLAERLRVTLQPSFRSTFLDDRASAYRDLVEALWAAGRAREAHRLVDRIKARSLVDHLTLPDAPQRPDDPREAHLMAELAEAQRAYRSLGSLTLPLPAVESQEVGLRAAPASSQNLALRRDLEARIVALSDELELLRAEGARGPERFHSRRLPRPGPGEGLLEYFITGRRILGFLSDRSGLRLALDLGRPEPVHQNLSLFYLNVEATARLVEQMAAGRPAPETDAGGADISSAQDPQTLPEGALEPLSANARAILARLYGQLYRPFGSLLAGLDRVVVVPHGFLHAAPFAALLDGETHAVERQETVVAPSVALWRHVARSPRNTEPPSPPAGRALVMGYSLGGLLPGADIEARQVAALLESQALTGEQAASPALSQRPARLIHVAAHGDFRIESPRFSALYLADGPFTARDAAQLRLDASLAVLSSCQSGVGRLSQADELAGLAAGFLLSGCRSLVVSRWRISDAATVPFMHAFYRHLLRGESKAGALRSAQLESLGSRRRHPYFWAAFVLMGASGPL